MANITDFINWYMLQSFPSFRTEILDTAAASVLSGYDEAKTHVLSLPGTDRDPTALAMAHILDVMDKYGLTLEDASYFLKRLNNIISAQK